jgi:hypothetical protein
MLILFIVIQHVSEECEENLYFSPNTIADVEKATLFI